MFLVMIGRVDCSEQSVERELRRNGD